MRRPWRASTPPPAHSVERPRTPPGTPTKPPHGGLRGWPIACRTNALPPGTRLPLPTAGLGGVSSCLLAQKWPWNSGSPRADGCPSLWSIDGMSSVYWTLMRILGKGATLWMPVSNCVPMKPIVWLGTGSDLSKLMIQPRCWRTRMTKLACSLAWVSHKALMSQSSRYTWRRTPCIKSLPPWAGSRRSSLTVTSTVSTSTPSSSSSSVGYSGILSTLRDRLVPLGDILLVTKGLVPPGRSLLDVPDWPQLWQTLEEVLLLEVLSLESMLIF